MTLRSRKSSIRVSAATNEELPRVLRWFRAMLDEIPYYNAIAKRDERAKHTISYLRDKLRADRYAVLVARDGSRILGFTISRFDDHLIWLEWLVVNSDSRRRGVASALIQKLIETAPKRNAHKIWCDTRTTNEPAKSTFRKNGFREIAEVKNHWYHEDYILWERPV